MISATRSGAGLVIRFEMLILLQNYKTFFKGTIRISPKYGSLVARNDRHTNTLVLRSGQTVEKHSRIARHLLY